MKEMQPLSFFLRMFETWKKILMVMKLKEGFMLRQIGSDFVIVPEGVDVVDFNKLISVNGSAKYLWESLQDKDFEEEEVARLLTDKYEVDEAVALKDAGTLLGKWKEIGLLE